MALSNQTISFTSNKTFIFNFAPFYKREASVFACIKLKHFDIDDIYRTSFYSININVCYISKLTASYKPQS